MTDVGVGAPLAAAPKKRSLPRLDANVQAALWFVLSFVALVLAWQWYFQSGLASKLLPAPAAVAANLVDALRDPVYSHGDND